MRFQLMPAVRRIEQILNARPLVLLAGMCVLLTFGVYLRLHASLLALPSPLTTRESAPILQTENLLTPGRPAPYSEASAPSDVNVYGPIYPIVAAPGAAFMPQAPYLAHRLGVMLALVLGCGLLGWSAAKTKGRFAGAVAATLFYCANVATPSVAAGPDMLATLFYIGALLVIRHRGCTPAAIATATLLSLLGLMTKPYLVWALPCLLIYLAYRWPWRRALIAIGAIVLATAAWMAVSHAIWPGHFFSVFRLHAISAGRSAAFLRSQLLDFGGLNFAVILLAAIAVPWRSLASLKQRGGPAGSDADALHEWLWPAFVTLATLAPLLLSLGWHPGAYMIYFNHLLLPPLLLTAFSGAKDKERSDLEPFGRALVVANAAVLIAALPAMPEGQTGADLTKLRGPVLADPVLERARRVRDDVDLVDNGQAEYWIRLALARGSETDRARAVDWTEARLLKLADRHYATILMAPHGVYERPGLWGREFVAAELDGYTVTGVFHENIYFGTFYYRSLFGRKPMPIYVLSRKTADPAPASPVDLIKN